MIDSVCVSAELHPWQAREWSLQHNTVYDDWELEILDPCFPSTWIRMVLVVKSDGRMVALVPGKGKLPGILPAKLNGHRFTVEHQGRSLTVALATNHCCRRKI